MAEKSDEENAAPIPGATAATPLVGPEGPSQTVDLNTAGATVPKPRGRGRPSKASQSRLSQRLEASAPSTEEEMEEAVAPKHGNDSDDDVVEIEDSDIEEDEDAGEAYGRRNTRQRVTRLAAVQRAEARLQEFDAEFNLEDNAEEFVPSDSDDEMEEVAPVARGRGRGRRAGATTVVDATIVEEDNRPEEPDDGVHPRNNHLWEDSVREGLPEILKQMTQQQMIELIQDQEDTNWESKMYKYQARDRDGRNVVSLL